MCCSSYTKVTDLSVGIVYSGRDDRFALSYLHPLLCPHNEPWHKCAWQLARGSQGLGPWARAKLTNPLRAGPMTRISLAPCSKQLSRHKNQQWLRPFCLRVKQIRSLWQLVVQAATREFPKNTEEPIVRRIIRVLQSFGGPLPPHPAKQEYSKQVHF